MNYGTLVMYDGSKVLIEVDSQERDGILLSEKGIAQDLKEEFQAVVNLAKTTALSAHYTYVNIPEPARPDELELTFGVKISSEAGVVFARLASEGSFQITMRWK